MIKNQYWSMIGRLSMGRYVDMAEVTKYNVINVTKKDDLPTAFRVLYPHLKRWENLTEVQSFRKPA
jgi:hypothetical protein